MASFRFDFGNKNPTQSTTSSQSGPLQPCQEVQTLPSSLKVGEELTRHITLSAQPPVTFRILRAPKAESIGQLQHVVQETDILHGVYEGGFKLWECSVDLANYVASTFKHTLQGKSVLEVVRGVSRYSAVAPMLGLFAKSPQKLLLCFVGAQQVILSDYNKEVLENLTCVNLMLNFETDVVATKCRMYAGDWSSIPNKLVDCNARESGKSPSSPRKYDLIFTADTLYTNEVTESLLEVILKHMAYPSGMALIAAKRYYFGTGGSVQYLKQLIESRNRLYGDKNTNAGVPYQIQLRALQSVEDGKSNIRDILELSFQ